jgi:hypothetical protein
MGISVDSLPELPHSEPPASIYKWIVFIRPAPGGGFIDTSAAPWNFKNAVK